MSMFIVNESLKYSHFIKYPLNQPNLSPGPFLDFSGNDIDWKFIRQAFLEHLVFRL